MGVKHGFRGRNIRGTRWIRIKICRPCDEWSIILWRHVEEAYIAHSFRAVSGRPTTVQIVPASFIMDRYAFVHPDEALLQQLPLPAPAVITQCRPAEPPVVVADFDLQPVPRDSRSIARVVYSLSRNLRDVHHRRVQWPLQEESFVFYPKDHLC